MSDTVAVPIDVRFVNMTTALLVTAVVLGALGSALWWVLHNPVFSIRGITVQGDTAHNSAESLSRSVTPRLLGNFFTLDLGAARSAFESAPWVRKAVVRRQFPDRLNVVLQEHVPIAHWGADDQHLVNTQGEVFEAAGDDPDFEALPRLIGPAGQATTVLAMQRELAPHFAPLGTLRQLELLSRGGWRATLGHGAVIELGQGDARTLAARVDLLAETAPDVAARHERGTADIQSADMRYPGGFALRLRGVGTATEDAGAKPQPR